MNPVSTHTRDVVLDSQAFGAAGDPAVVLIMGATASMLWWPEAFCQDLAAAGMYVIRYDHRDTGQSTTLPPGQVDYAVEDMTDDLFAVMGAHGLDAAHMVGMSLGGMIAQMAAVMRPDRVLSLTLVASEPLGGSDAPLPGIDEKFMTHFNSMGDVDWCAPTSVAAFLLEIARLSAGSGAEFDDQAALARIHAEIDRASSIQSAFNHGLVTARADWSGRAREIAQPALVIHGAEDPILPLPNGQAIQALLPNAAIEVFDGVGHELSAPGLNAIRMGLLRNAL